MNLYTVSHDGETITFSYTCDLKNDYNSQLAEVDLALSFWLGNNRNTGSGGLEGSKGPYHRDQ